MFNKKKKNITNVLNLASNEKDEKKVKTKKTLIVNNEINNTPLNQSKRKTPLVDINEHDMIEFESNPLLTSSNNVKFLNKLLNTNTQPLDLKTPLNDEDKQVVHMLSQLQEYLPLNENSKVFITLTYAQSLDSKIGFRFKKTPISHIETKQMTHFLRYYHDCIVVGFNTFKEDNPNLNFKYYNNTMRYFLKDTNKNLVPIILDRNLRILDYIKENNENDINLKKNYDSKTGAKPIFVCFGSKYDVNTTISSNWFDILPVPDEIFNDMSKLFDFISKQNTTYKRFMIEGGATIINEILQKDYADPFVDSKILTIAPIYLGNDAVSVTPNINDKMTLQNVHWMKGSSDAVLLSKK
ncbi:hypothetical protein ACO0SA_004886 [Hanseniaspora valbyensis]